MRKYRQGIYLVRFFDKYGSKSGNDMNASNLTQAEQIGDDIKSEECNVNSYVVMRVLQNSLDKQT